MIRHVVLVRLGDSPDPAVLEGLWKELEAVCEAVPGVVGVCAGQGIGPSDVARGYGHGFVVDFADSAVAQAYQDHPLHRAFGARLLSLTEGGIEGLLVFDLDVPDPAGPALDRDASC